MLFSEVYGTYYRVLAKLLAQAVEGKLTREGMYATIREYGFEESVLTIPEALETGTWPLLGQDYSTPLDHAPAMPLTTLQRRWLRTLLEDPRIRLFDPPREGLEDVEPLYDAGAIVYFDRYGDGDPFEDADYIRHFRCVLTAIREKRWLRVRFTGHNGASHCWRCVPRRLEYSAKDDKFRLICADKRSPLSINLARITHCALLGPCSGADCRTVEMKKRVLVLELTDERNALERAMLHFSHLEKETQRLDGDRYRIRLFYEREDETEMLIRVLSFGPMLKVLFPEDFIGKLRSRLQMQHLYDPEPREEAPSAAKIGSRTNLPR